jgi:hemoglobin
MEPVIAQTQFDQIGGAPAVEQLVDAFYRNMDTLPAAKGIRALHADDLGEVSQVLKKYLTEWLGGPKLYSAERGHPRLRMRHMSFPIGRAERDAWLLCMQLALDEVVSSVRLRELLMQQFLSLADWMRNDARFPHTPH